MTVYSGLDVLTGGEYGPLRAKRVGVVCNQASISRDLRHIAEVFLQAHREGRLRLCALFGPQHGIWGHTQDNMIEWEGYVDPVTALPVFSLYGSHRKPTVEMLSRIETLVIDLQDVGSRYYTFIWTMAHCLEACGEAGTEVVILDRPNPLSGLQVEGCMLEEPFRSFVGLHPLPIRHGMTIGEIARYFQSLFYPDCRMSVIRMKGWDRSLYFEATRLTWVCPSPNMPSPDTAVVYPGMCLLEATNISEGRGTTRPFELFGAPWIDGWQLAQVMNGCGLDGVYFRPVEFQPTFHKFAGEKCGGVFIHVTDRARFKPFVTGLVAIREVMACRPEAFAWKDPPYEYEYEKRPFDILVGNGWLRGMIEAQEAIGRMEDTWRKDLAEFLEVRNQFLLY